MLEGRRSRAVRFGALVAVLALSAASAAVAAPGTGSSGSVDATTQQLGTSTQQALLSLYALDSRLQAWRGRLASLQTAAAAMQERRATLRKELHAERVALKIGERQLALELRALYERGDVSAVAVVLGAKSLSTGLSQLDDMSRVAEQSRQVAAAATAAHSRLIRSERRLAVEERRLEHSLAAAKQAEASLSSAVASRTAYIASLRAHQQLRAEQVRSVETQAQSAQTKSQQLAPSTSAPTGKRQLVVSATCYDLPGRTATGMPVGPGVVAVDPSVIPLGTRLYVPGYGNSVAADVGGGIKGDTIDLWMTPSQCATWGRRTVTITLY
jgi:3D (Asp-Asp-Asp) domain-containing protein